MQKINCSNCLKDLHNECLNPESCLCADNKHGVEKTGDEKWEKFLDDWDKVEAKDRPKREELVKLFAEKNKDKTDDDFIKEWNQVNKPDSERDRLDDYCDNGTGGNGSIYVMKDMVKIMITVRHITSLTKINDILANWCIKFGVDLKEIEDLAVGVMYDHKIFPQVKEICFEKGIRKEKEIYDESQMTEASYWLMGRFHIKRLDLTGDLIFFNDEYYEKNAEALIRREARNCFYKSKKGTMNEIVALVQDSCKLITWQDIEDSIHIKCLANGTYDIANGIFQESFSPDNIVLNQIPHRFDELSNWPNIDRIVSTIITDDNDRQSYYDSISNSLRPYTGIDFQFGGVGQAGTGKSQLCILVELVLGKENVGGASIQSIASDPTTQKSMAFKMINIDQDMSSTSINQVDVLKKWITQDSFTARGIYEQPVTFKPMSRLMFMANELYEIASEDDAEAIYERTHVIRIDNKFRGTNDQVTNIMRAVAVDEELDGFITYLLKNSHEITKSKQIHHPMNFQTVREIWNTYGNRVKEFCNKWLVMGVGERIDQDEVWGKWVWYAQRNNYKIKDKKKFRPVIEEITGSSPSKTSSDGSTIYAYHGFRLKTNNELQKEETSIFSEIELENQTKDVLLSLLKGIMRSQKK